MPENTDLPGEASLLVSVQFDLDLILPNNKNVFVCSDASESKLVKLKTRLKGIHPHWESAL